MVHFDFLELLPSHALHALPHPRVTHTGRETQHPASEGVPADWTGSVCCLNALICQEGCHVIPEGHGLASQFREVVSKVKMVKQGKDT